MSHKQLVFALLSLTTATLSAAADDQKPTRELRARCLDVLRDGIQGDEFWPAIHAAEALTLAGKGREVRQYLEPKLKVETDDQRKCGLARELVRAGDRERSTVMMNILNKSDDHGHVHAAESLYKVGWIGDGKPIQRAFAEGKSIRLRIMAAAAVAKHVQGEQAKQAFALLRTTLSDNSDPAIFRLVAWVLARIGDDQDRAPIRARLADTQDDALAKAFLHFALAARGDPDGSKALMESFQSDDPAIRTYAAVFAGESGMNEAVPQLTRQLSDKNIDARIRAAQALIVLAN